MPCCTTPAHYIARGAGVACAAALAIGFLVTGCRERSAAEPAPAIPYPDLIGADQTVIDKVTRARAMVRKDPDSAITWGRLGMVLDAHGFDDGAKSCYRHAALLDATDVRWPYLTGLIAQLDDPVGAAEWFEAAIDLDPQSPAIRQTYAAALVRAGRPDDARRQYQAALRIDPGFRKALLGVAELEVQNGALDEALKLLQRAAEMEFCEREVHVKLARLFQRLGEPARARHEALIVRAYPALAPVNDPYRAQVDIERVSVKAYVQRGLAYLASQRYAEAERAFRQALHLRSDSVRNHLNLGGVLVRQKRLAESLEIFHRALDMAPEDPEVHNNLAVALGEAGDQRGAIEHLRTALRLDPNHDEAHFNLGRIREDQGRLDEAMEAYQKAIDINPVNVPAHNELARLLSRGGRTADAFSHWRDAFAFGCRDPAAAFNLALVMAQRRQFGEAVDVLRRGLTKAPDHEALTAMLATILATCPEARYRNGPEAVKLANRLLARNGSDHVPSLNLMAAGQAEAGDYKGAAETSERALRLAQRAQDAELVRLISARLVLYWAGEPYHQP